MAQSGLVADAIAGAHRRPGRARRDHARTATSPAEPLAQIGGTGVFVTALRDALLRRRGRLRRPLAQGPADRAARRASSLAAVPQREDPRDVARRPRRPEARRPAPRAPRSAPARRAAWPSSTRTPGPGLDIETVRSAATSTPGSATSATGELDAVVLAARRAQPARAGSTRSTDFLVRRHDAARARPGGAGGRVRRRTTRTSLAALGRARRPAHPGRRDRRARPARRPGGRLLAHRWARCRACWPTGRLSRDVPARRRRHVDGSQRCSCPPPVPSRATTAMASAANSRRDARRGRGRSYGGASTLSPTRPTIRRARTGPAAGPEIRAAPGAVGAGPGDPGCSRVRAVELLRRGRRGGRRRRSARDAVLAALHASTWRSSTARRQPPASRCAARPAPILSWRPRGRGKRVVRLLDGDPALDGYAGRGGRGLRQGEGAVRGRARRRRAVTACRRTRVCRCVTRRARSARSSTPSNEPELDWESLRAIRGHARRARTRSTSIGEAARQLVAAGRKPDTPLTVTVAGTTTGQRTVAVDAGADRAARRRARRRMTAGP